jgi:hypothetical protein
MLVPRTYGYTLHYRAVAPFLVGNDGPGHLVTLDSGGYVSAETRDAALQAHVTDMESARQGYRVERVTYDSACARCHGTGRVRVNPKGWRKRTPAPWFMAPEVNCPSCHGPDHARTIESEVTR